MMRQRGTIRVALERAIWAISAERAQQQQYEQAGATWREAAQRAQVGYGAARQTVNDMVRAGHLQPVAKVPAINPRHAMTLYRPADFVVPDARMQSLEQVLRTWVEGIE